ncbi:hypothetical protein [Flavobacterium quisquiliarum]|uniref:Uncharacterized protein n=1 Tax=Flavobacterium quisquiliarum TaxID=1834436 RepID=A0ABV8W6Z2_9FLAO|nr:hypothetical protein [Flavobacterium quisquiliarum]MBW1654363.1 hypothetical protein [Flavobacterium quisquiliarum]
MNTLDINTIAFQYLLRNNSLNNNAEETAEAVKYNPEQRIKNQKSLLFHLYDLEEEADQ